MIHYGQYPMPPREAIQRAYEQGVNGRTNTLYANPWLGKAFVGGMRKATGKGWMLSVVGTARGIYYGAESIERNV